MKWKNMWQENFIKAVSTQKEQKSYNAAIRKYETLPWYVKIMKSAPTPPKEGWDDLCDLYTKQLIMAHKTPSEIRISCNKDPDEKSSCFPILEFWTYQQGCYIVTRQALQPDGSTVELGCPYPYSECGLTGRTMEYNMEVKGMKEKYDIFDTLLSEIKTFIKDNQDKIQ